MNLKKLIPWKERDDRQVASRMADADPFRLLENRLMEPFIFGRSPLDFRPRIDVRETGKEVRVTAELPGLDEKDIDVTVSGNVLTIAGEKKEEMEDESGDSWQRECSYGCFRRSIQLPRDTDSEHAGAKFRRGVLKITIPKKAGMSGTRRRIELTD